VFKWTFREDAWLRAATYVGFRPPTLNELHRPFRVGNDVTEANPALTPETLYGGELGIGGSGFGDWALTIFQNQIKDPVTNVTVGVGPRTFPVAGFIPAGGALRMRQNAGEIIASGVEAELRRSYGAVRLDLPAPYPGASGWRCSSPQLTGKRPAQAPRLTITAGLNWEVSPRLTLSTNARYESDRFEDDLNTRVLPASVSVGRAVGMAVGGTCFGIRGYRKCG